MWNLTGHLTGHLGANISALIDGQLAPEEEERAWQHALGCPGCRQRVQAETWIKKRMAGLSCDAFGTDADLDGDTFARMYDVESWAAVDELEHNERRRRAPLIAVGAGSVGLAVVGLMALTSAPAGRGEVPPHRPSVQANVTGFTTPAAAPLRRAPR